MCVCWGWRWGAFFSFTPTLHAPHHWDRSVCSSYTTEKKTGGYRSAVSVRPNIPLPCILRITPRFFPSLVPSTGSTQAGAQTVKALRLGKMQTYPTPSGFGHRECSDGPVSVLFCSLDLQPLWLPKGKMSGTLTGPQGTGSSLETHRPSAERAGTRPARRPSTWTERTGRSDD